MAYGVTPDGFVRPRLPEIRQEVIADLRARLRAQGLPDDIETRPDSVTGLLIDTFAEREAALWEMGEGVYYAMYPGSASGVSLDRSVSFTGVRRLTDEPSRGYVVAYGAAGTHIPAGAQIRNRIDQSLWFAPNGVTIAMGAVADATIVPVVANETVYTVTLDGTPYSYTSDATATISEILAGLVAALSTSGVQVSSNGAALRLWIDGRQAFSLALTASIALNEIGSPMLVETLEPSAQGADAGDLNGIVTRVDGWDRVNNLQAASAGRRAENDAELRARYPTGLFRLGAATPPSIAPNIRDRVQGVQAVRVFRNDSDFVDEVGRLPHSIHVVVEGGLDDEIAEAIFRVKAAGIDTNGAVEIGVIDDEGAIQPIRFDRPAPVFVWVRAVLTLLPAAEQAFPPDGFDRVAESIAAIGAAHEIGQDVVTQRFFCGIYQTPGIALVDLQFAHSTDPGFEPAPEDFSSENVEIKEFEVAKFDRSRIEVT